ncbi:Protein M3 [Podochytrium sp. JEL0797]|nr:Protein M3 [Podochytrium sp. JEL0797]
MSVGNNPPFNQGDSVIGVVYVSAYLCFTNLFFFSVGYHLFGKDVESLHIPESPRGSKTSQSMHHGLPPKSKINDLMGSVAVLSPKNFSRDHLVKSVDASRVGSVRASVVMERLSSASVGHVAADGKISQNSTSPMGSGMVVDSDGQLVDASKKQRVSFWSTVAWIVGQVKFVLTSLLSPANTAFLAAAAVPLGLINLGAALGRLDIKSLISFKVISGICICRLVLMPVLGIVAVELLVEYGVIDRSDKILRFVLMLEACMPTASSTVYFTQMWHPKGEANAIAGGIFASFLYNMPLLLFFLHSLCQSF